MRTNGAFNRVSWGLERQLLETSTLPTAMTNEPFSWRITFYLVIFMFGDSDKLVRFKSRLTIKNIAFSTDKFKTR